MSEIGADPQLDIWRLEGEIERCSDPAKREALVRRRLDAQRELVADPPLVTVADRLPTLPGIDMCAALEAFRQMTPEQQRAHDAAAARRREDERRLRLDGDAERRERARRSALSTIPTKLLPLALDPSGLRRTAAVAAVQGLSSGLVVLTGPHDAGKSQAAAVALAPRGLWVAAPRLLDAWMRRRGKDNGLSREDLIEARRLVIDELGREGGTHEQRLLAAEALVALAHLRSEEAELLTVFTTNRDRAGLRDALTISRGATPAMERWTLFTERLRAHGRTAATTAEIEKLGGRVPWPGFVECPHEGFRRRKP